MRGYEAGNRRGRSKLVRCLYVKPAVNNRETASLDLQEVLCHSLVRKQGWSISSESYGSLYFDDEATPNLFQQLIDICCTAALSDFDVLLIASQQCLSIPEEYFKQVVGWLRENNVEVWSVSEGKLA